MPHLVQTATGIDIQLIFYSDQPCATTVAGDGESKILAYLRMRGIFCWKNNTAGIYRSDRNTYIPSHAKGVADILGILDSKMGRPGVLLAIEVKTAKGKLSPHQEVFLNEVNNRGGMGFVARSVEDVQRNIPS